MVWAGVFIGVWLCGWALAAVFILESFRRGGAFDFSAYLAAGFFGALWPVFLPFYIVGRLAEGIWRWWHEMHGV